MVSCFVDVSVSSYTITGMFLLFAFFIVFFVGYVLCVIVSCFVDVSVSSYTITSMFLLFAFFIVFFVGYVVEAIIRVRCFFFNSLESVNFLCSANERKNIQTK